VGGALPLGGLADLVGTVLEHTEQQPAAVIRGRRVPLVGKNDHLAGQSNKMLDEFVGPVHGYSFLHQACHGSAGKMRQINFDEN
jgi:hypothetical protein